MSKQTEAHMPAAPSAADQVAGPEFPRYETEVKRTSAGWGKVSKRLKVKEGRTDVA